MAEFSISVPPLWIFAFVVFLWANFKSPKAPKLLALLDLETAIPKYIFVTDDSVNTSNVLDVVSFSGGIYIFMYKANVDL